MTTAIRIGDPAIEIRLRRNGRARRMVLRVSRTSEGPILTLPPSASLSQARAFLVDHEGWLRSQLAAQPRRSPVGVGASLPFRGGALTVRRSEGRCCAIRDGSLHVPGPERDLPARAAAFLRDIARQRCLEASERHAARLGRPFRRITLRDTRGRWGSCSSAGDLMFSWRLILSPDDVLDYVAAHEVAHLAEMNHSARFWDLVAVLRPDYAPHRDWLRQHGAELMAYDFAPAG